MGGRGSFKLRMIGDLILIGRLVFVAPVAHAPMSRNWPTLLMAFAALFVAIGCWYDFLRTLQRFRKLRTY